MKQSVTIDINTLVSWSAPKRVQTRNGERDLMVAAPTQSFWDVYRQHRDFLKDAGVSCGKNARSGQWEVCWWKPIPVTEQIAKNEAIAASSASFSNAVIPAPIGLDYLPYQKAGITYALNKPNVLIADEMGLGKTIQAIGVINSDTSIKSVVIVCPATLKLNWHRELTKWLTNGDLTVGIATGKTGIPQTDIVIINYDIVGRFSDLQNRTFDLLILDECHLLKNPKSKRASAVLGSKGIGGIKAKRNVFLTGTPILNRPMDIYPLISKLDAVNWGNFWQFAKRYCNAVQTQYGWDMTGATNLTELQRRLRETVMVRRMKQDVLTELPPKRRQVVELEDVNGIVDDENDAMGNLQSDMDHDALEVEIIAAGSENWDDYKAKVAKMSDRTFPFEQISGIRHRTALGKAPMVIEYVDEMLESVNKIILFAHHRDVIAQFEAHWGSSAVTIMGGMSADSKQAAVDRFQNDVTCKVAICSIQAAGVGLTLTASSTVVFAELDWVPGNVTQCEDRAHRIGQKDSVNVIHLVLKGSLDGRMAHTIVRKQSIIEAGLNSGVSATEPIIPVTVQTLSFEEMEKAAKVTAELTKESEIVLKGLRMLAGVCDGAQTRDDMGFNGRDTRFGKMLASLDYLTPKQALVGARMVNLYHRQLPKEIVDAAKVILEKAKLIK